MHDASNITLSLTLAVKTMLVLAQSKRAKHPRNILPLKLSGTLEAWKRPFRAE